MLDVCETDNGDGIIVKCLGCTRESTMPMENLTRRLRHNQTGKDIGDETKWIEAIGYFKRCGKVPRKR